MSLKWGGFLFRALVVVLLLLIVVVPPAGGDVNASPVVPRRGGVPNGVPPWGSGSASGRRLGLGAPPTLLSATAADTGRTPLLELLTQMGGRAREVEAAEAGEGEVADAPGAANTGSPASRAARTSGNPGSESKGVPASEIRATLPPRPRSEMIFSTIARSL